MTETEKEQRRYALAISGGVCEVCGRPLCDGQPQGAHRIGNTKTNRAKYGDFVIDHRFNIGMTCCLKCNGALDISGDIGAVTRLCARIYAAEAQKYGGEKMRESFVFHKDYIEDLPDQYKAEFMQATINYGLYGDDPPFLSGSLEMALWAKIARRIDAESERYQAISGKRREAAQKRYAQKCGDNAKATPPNAKNANAEAKPAKAEAAKPARFEKPTVAEIAAYCSERKNGIDAQAFFDFYESKGWKVGAVKMKDWRASVRTWEQRHKTESGGRSKAGGIWGNENEIPDEITDLF